MHDDLDIWGEDGDEFPGTCDCCPGPDGNLLVGLAWAFALLFWMIATVVTLVTGLYGVTFLLVMGLAAVVAIIVSE